MIYRTVLEIGLISTQIARVTACDLQ